MLKAIFTILPGTALSQAIALAASPIIARLFSPAEFGALGIFSSYLAILTLIGCLRYELAIPLPQSNRGAWALAALCALLLGALSILLAIIIAAFGDFLTPLLGAGTPSQFIFLLPIGLVLSGSFQIATQLAIRYREYSSLAITRVIQATLAASIQLIGGFAGFSTGALITGQIAGSGSGTLRIAMILRQQGMLFLKTITIDELRKHAARYRSFVWLASPAALLNGLALNLPTILIAMIYGAGTAGQFFLAQRVLNVPISVLSTAVSQSYMGEASALHRDNDPAIKQLFWKSTIYLAAFSLMVTACIYYLSPILFETIFGETWGQSGRFASLMALFLGVRFITTSLAPTLIIFERQDLSLLLQVIAATAAACSFLIAWTKDLDPNGAVALYSLLMMTPYVIGFLFHWRTIRINIPDDKGFN